MDQQFSKIQNHELVIQSSSPRCDKWYLSSFLEQVVTNISIPIYTLLNEHDNYVFRVLSIHTHLDFKHVPSRWYRLFWLILPVLLTKSHLFHHMLHMSLSNFLLHNISTYFSMLELSTLQMSSSLYCVHCLFVFPVVFTRSHLFHHMLYMLLSNFLLHNISTYLSTFQLSTLQMSSSLY